MALYLRVSNSLTGLTEQLGAALKENNKNVFQPNFLVTQTEGMNSWLKLELTSQLGIAANCRFLKPNDLIQQVFKILGGQYQQTLSPQNQCWLLYQLLGDSEFKDKFKNIADYYTQAGAEKDLKRLALAEKIADLFDQYQMYRPEMIRDWNKGELRGLEHEDWQMYLWTKAQSLSEGCLLDKTYISDYIIKALQDTESQHLLRSKISQVQLVGLSVLTDFHLHLFQLLGKYIDLSFYLLNPAPSQYWFDDKSEKVITYLKNKMVFNYGEESFGNPLLTSWGGVLQNTFGLLFKNDELINSYEEVGVVEPEGSSLLQKIQSELFHNRSNKEREQLGIEDLQDGSISVHSCFTPVREVEALYNYLVRLIDKGEENLSARDIVVMVSDVDTYAPYIKSIFDNAAFKFPYTIADESYTASDTIASALLAVLAMDSQGFKGETVMQLLDSSYIRNRFGITDLSLIRSVVDKANFRFGIKGREEDDSIFMGWEYVSQRILYGICMSGDEEYFTEDQSLFPLDILEGSDSLEIVRFMHFMEMLINSIEEREQSRSLGDWVVYVKKVLENLVFDPTGKSDDDYQTLINQLGQYYGMSVLATEDLSYQVFHHNLKTTIGKTVRTGAFASGGVTFCSLIPMRSVPFKVVALLGLNFDKFPRKENQLSFNLIDVEKRKGDRNVKENDKHLFLETLLSAQKYLFISYLGQSVKDNTSIPPSALVDELLDYIQEACKENAAEELIVKHALHGFSNKYRKEDSKFYSYLNHQEASEIKLNRKEKEIQFDFSEIEIVSLINFLKHPIKGFFNKRLSIYYREEGVLLNDTELFELDSLQNWSLKNALLPLKNDDEVEQLKDMSIKTGALPLRNMASVVTNEAMEQVHLVRELLTECAKGEEEQPQSIDITFEELNTRIKGRISNIYGDRLIGVSWSKDSTKYLLEAYIKYLCLRAAGFEYIDCYFISAFKGGYYKAVQVDAIQAKRRLSNLIKLYMDGHKHLMPFHIELKIEPKELEALDFEKFKVKVYTAFDDPYFDQKVREGFFNLETGFDQYMTGAEVLLQPLQEFFPDFYN